MKEKLVLAVVIVIGLMLVLGHAASAQGPSSGPKATNSNMGYGFTYQGQLMKSGIPVSAPSCSFTFTLWDASENGNQKGGPLNQSLAVTNGLFNSNPLDFGVGAIQGEARYLQVAVQCPGDSIATALTRQALTPSPYALALPGLYTQQNVTSPNLIGGFSGNMVDSGVYAATISGGGFSTAINHVTANLGTIGGGYSNTAGNNATVGGGGYNSATSSNSTVGGGYWNRATAGDATVAGGNTNTAGGLDSTVGGGFANAASGNYSTIPGGIRAATSHYGELAYASGRFQSPGDAQMSIYVLRNTTTDGIWQELFLDDAKTQRITLAGDRTMAYEALVTARRDDGVSGAWILKGIVESHGGTSLSGTFGRETIRPFVGLNIYPEMVPIAPQDVRFMAQGAAGNNIRWVAVVKTTEVAY